MLITIQQLMVIFIHTNSLFPEFNTLKSDFQIGTVGWNCFLVYLSKDSFDKPSTTAVTLIAISFPGVS